MQFPHLFSPLRAGAIGLSNVSLETELDGLAPELHIIGDALGPRTAGEAVLDGLKVGALI